MVDGSLVSVRQRSDGSPPQKLTDACLHHVTGAFAAWAVLNQIALLFGASLHQLTIAYSVTLVIFVVWLVMRRGRRSSSTWTSADREAFLIVILLAILGALISLVAIRPDADDVNYLSRVVYYLEHPNTPLDLRFHDFWILTSEMGSALKLYQSWGFLCGYVAYLSGLPLLAVYHVALPALAGALLPVAWFGVFCRFTVDRRIAAAASLAVVAFLLLAGETHRSFGNFSFVRIWQGKTILMSGLAPYFLSLTLDFYRDPRWREWRHLMFASVAATGLSSTALFLLPALAGVLALAVWWREPRPLQDHLRLSIAYFGAQAYLVALGALSFVQTDRAYLAVIGERGWPTSFAGQFHLVFGHWPSPTFVGAIVCAALALHAVSRADRFFLLTWLLATVLLLLNPVVFPLLAKLTTHNAYWRLFYVLPIPLVIGLAFLELEHATNRALATRTAATLVVASAALVLWFDPMQTTLGHGVRFGAMEYKLDRASLADARSVVSVSPPGPMLAPYRLSQVIPLLTSRYPQVVVRAMNLNSHAIAHHEQQQARLRLAASAYVSGKGGSYEGIAFLADHGLQTIVVDATATRRADWHDAEALMRSRGFELISDTPRCRIYSTRRGLFPAAQQP